jgi:hypothetical protein
MRSLSEDFRKAINSQSTGEVVIVLLTITHPNFSEDIRVCSDPYETLPIAGVKGVVSQGLEYVYLPFSIQLPTQDDTNTPRASLSIDNIDRRIVAAARQASSKLSVKIEIVLSSDVDNPEISVDNFKLQNVTFDAFAVNGELSMDYYDLEPFPYARLTPTYFPGAF